MSLGDQRLFERGTGREAVAADLKRVVAHCGSVAETAECLEIGQSTIFAVLAGGAIGPKLLTALYGESGCALPAEWAAEPPAAEDAPVADQGTPATPEDVIAAIDIAVVGSASAAVDSYSHARAVEIAHADASPPFATDGFAVQPPPQPAPAKPCGCHQDGQPVVDWRALARAEFVAKIAEADAAVAAAVARRDDLGTALRMLEELAS